MRARCNRFDSSKSNPIAIRGKIAGDAHPWTHNRFVLDYARAQVAAGRHGEALETLSRLANPPSTQPTAQSQQPPQETPSTQAVVESRPSVLSSPPAPPS